MKSVYILAVAVLVAGLALGCIGKNAPESDAVPVLPAETPLTSSVDEFGTESDLMAMDSLVNDSSMDISLSATI